MKAEERDGRETGRREGGREGGRKRKRKPRGQMALSDNEKLCR